MSQNGKGDKPRNIGPKFKENYDSIDWSPKSQFRCDYCGRFISLSDFENNKAIRNCTSVDTEFSSEEYETYHVKCKSNNL